MDADGLLAGLDEDQRRAVSTTEQPLCILAGAGSGKTRVLTRRIAHRAAVGDADPRKVLALTFTRKAAGELEDRLARLGLRDRPAAGTFHAIAYAQLRAAWTSARRRPPTLLERKGSVLGPLVGRRGPLTAAELAGEIEWSKARLVPPDAYPDAAREANRLTSVDFDRIASLYRRYEDEKRQRGVVDFDDLLIECLAAMDRDRAFADAQRWRFRHLFVDEFQDVNPLQFRLLRAWLGESSDLCVVGDPAQAIYRWNGADAGYLVRFAEYFPEATVVELRSNYRSSPEILHAAGRVLGTAAGVDRAPPLAHRPPGNPPVVSRHPTDTDEAAAVARAIRDQHGPGRTWSSQAVLVRTNGQLPVLEAALRQAGIPHRVRGGRRFAERAEIRDALRAARRVDGPFTVWLADLESAVDATKEQLASTTAVSDSGPAGASVEEQLASAEPGTTADRIVGLEQLIRLGHEFAVLDPTAATRAFPQWLHATVRGEDDERGDAVQLATFHAAKGLEWPVVHLAGFEQGFVPIAHARDDASVAEERRLLHVAVTRAADTLSVTWAAARTFGKRTVDRQPSPWLRLLAAEGGGAWLDPGHVETVGAPAGASRATRGRSPGVEARGRRGVEASRRQLAAAAEHRPSRLRVDDEPARRAAFDALWAWRSRAARQAGVPGSVVLPDRVLDALARDRPDSMEALEAVDGLTTIRARRYGDGLLAVLAEATATSASMERP